MPLLCGLIFIITLNQVADGLVINGRIDQCLYQDLSSHCMWLLVILKSGTRTCSGKYFLSLSWCSRLNISLVIRIMDINFLFSSLFHLEQINSRYQNKEILCALKKQMMYLMHFVQWTCQYYIELMVGRVRSLCSRDCIIRIFYGQRSFIY